MTAGNLVTGAPGFVAPVLSPPIAPEEPAGASAKRRTALALTDDHDALTALIKMLGHQGQAVWAGPAKKLDRVEEYPRELLDLMEKHFPEKLTAKPGA